MNAPAHAAAVRETKFAPLDLQRVSEEGSFKGYAAQFGIVDLGGDMIMPGAFRDSLASRPAAAVRMLFQHDPAQPIGSWQEAREDGHGLWVKGKLNADVARAREILSLMRDGAIDGLSIGYRTVKAKREGRGGQRRLIALDLWEISVVTFPMQPGARIGSVKSRPFDDGIPTEREFERWLKREAGLTRSEARTVVCAGFKALARKLEAAGGSDDTARLNSVITEATALIQQASKR